MQQAPLIVWHLMNSRGEIAFVAWKVWQQTEAAKHLRDGVKQRE